MSKKEFFILSGNSCDEKWWKGFFIGSCRPAPRPWPRMSSSSGRQERPWAASKGKTLPEPWARNLAVQSQVRVDSLVGGIVLDQVPGFRVCTQARGLGHWRGPEEVQRGQGRRRRRLHGQRPSCWRWPSPWSPGCPLCWITNVCSMHDGQQGE